MTDGNPEEELNTYLSIDLKTTKLHAQSIVNANLQKERSLRESNTRPRDDCAKLQSLALATELRDRLMT